MSEQLVSPLIDTNKTKMAAQHEFIFDFKNQQLRCWNDDGRQEPESTILLQNCEMWSVSIRCLSKIPVSNKDAILSFSSRSTTMNRRIIYVGGYFCRLSLRNQILLNFMHAAQQWKAIGQWMFRENVLGLGCVGNDIYGDFNVRLEWWIQYFYFLDLNWPVFITLSTSLLQVHGTMRRSVNWMLMISLQHQITWACMLLHVTMLKRLEVNLAF